MKTKDKLFYKLLEKRLQKIRLAAPETKIRGGWVKYMRQALTMTQANLAERSNKTAQGIHLIENREAKGKVTLETLQKLASSMKCELIYAFVPQTSVQEILFEQAKIKANEIIKKADVQMTLENQRVLAEFEDRDELLIEELLKKGNIW